MYEEKLTCSKSLNTTERSDTGGKAYADQLISEESEYCSRNSKCGIKDIKQSHHLSDYVLHSIMMFPSSINDILVPFDLSSIKYFFWKMPFL